ncbi:MAG: sugar phosphate isomerase/epimerase [Christensenella sp.]|uniref:sugar phosphate isomerase/epimerase family protein n=1 Tax=Christensenella sp. TaxID=1935934 RepID=UPI002B21D41A|nr:sugar phosphate isomerase/epimerase [Christensenella sp.]MEA5002808.1 sugar phosphate isomerase/epimerase [Christensenella sp.]
MKVTYSTNAWSPVMAHCAAANNVNGAYYMCPGSDEEAIAGIAAAGYDSIEMFDGNLLAYEGREDALRELLGKYGVELRAVYAACNFIYDEILPEEMYRLKKAAQFASRFGATQIALGGGATRYDGIKESDYAKLAEGLDRACEVADSLNMTASFHPHMGSLVESPEQLDKVMAKTRIKLCPDCGHVKLGGGDPLTVTKKYADRILYFHLKDVTKDGMFCPLGEGTIDFVPIIETLKSRGGEVLWAVECDGWSGDASEGAKITAEYLKNLL